MEDRKKFRSGFVTIVGRPNAGKSTLLNAIIREKVSIVSKKAQTTRNTVRGVANLPDGQIVFMDTPGIHRGKGLLSGFMLKEAASSLDSADAVVYITEADKEVSVDDELVIDMLKRVKAPVCLVINKIDKVDKRELLPLMRRYSGLYDFKEIMPVSALKNDGVEALVETLKGLLPEGPKYFPDALFTDQPERFIVAEMIREKIFLFTKEEIPYSSAVVIERFKEGERLVSITAVINVERESQKGIVIGKAGAMLKKIGTAARADIERILGQKVFLELLVRVEKDWTKKPDAMKGFGY